MLYARRGVAAAYVCRRSVCKEPWSFQILGNVVEVGVRCAGSTRSSNAPSCARSGAHRHSVAYSWESCSRVVFLVNRMRRTCAMRRGTAPRASTYQALRKLAGTGSALRWLGASPGLTSTPRLCLVLCSTHHFVTKNLSFLSLRVNVGWGVVGGP